MKLSTRLKSLFVLWLITLAPLMMLVPMLPSANATDSGSITVETVSTIRGTTSYAERHFVSTSSAAWMFYYNGTYVVDESSTDLENWSNQEVVFSNAPKTCYDSYPCTVIDVHIWNNTLIYAAMVNATNCAGGGGNCITIWFRKGNISGSSISWGSVIRAADAANANDFGHLHLSSVSISYDGTTFWASSTDAYGACNDYLFSKRKSTDGGNTWSDSSATPNCVYTNSIIKSMAGGNAISIYGGLSDGKLYSTIYTGAWGAAVLIDNSPGTEPLSAMYQFSALTDPSNNDIVYLAYRKGTNITFTTYNSGWGTKELIASDVSTTTTPVLSYDSLNSNIYIGYTIGDVVYSVRRYSNGTLASAQVVANESTTHIAEGRSFGGSEGTFLNKAVYYYTTGSGAPYNVTIAGLDVPVPITPSGVLTISGLKCGDIWVTPDKTYLTITATIQAQTAIQNVSVRFNDSLNVIQADYDNTTSRWNLSQGRDYVTLNQQATATSEYTAAGGPLSTDNYTLQVAFMFLANERILDRNDVDLDYMYVLQNGSSTSWTSNATMNIYNKGGATEYYIQNDAGFLPGGDVYSVYAKNTSSIGVNQTWVRLQHLHANFAIRLVLNSTDSGEDNLWQDLAHKGTNEYYTNSTDWTIYYKIWYYDEQNEAWVQGWILSFVKQQGDLGSADEWTEFNVTFYNGPNSEKTSSQNMSAWVEREPEARVRLWIDLWFNKINASSVHGARLNPMYFGIHYTGWAIWGTGVAGQWEPMYKNETQAAAFDNLQDANGVENVTSPMLTCMKTEQILVMNENTYNIAGISPLNYNYTLQIDNWDIFEPKLSPTRNMEGVNTPLIVEPLLPDKTASSFWAPIYAALASIGGWIFKAFASLAEIVWQAVRAQFPWFAEWVDNINAMLANGIEIANEMLSGLVEIFKMVGGQLWIFGFITDFIQQTWEVIYPILSPFTQNSTVWLTLLIIVFGILPIADNLTRGRWDLVKNDLEMIWGFMRTIIVGIYVIVTTLINWLISAIPL